MSACKCYVSPASGTEAEQRATQQAHPQRSLEAAAAAMSDLVREVLVDERFEGWLGGHLDRLDYDTVP